MKLAERYAGKTVLAVGAHGDDVELAVGGTMAKLRRAGARVVMVVVSLPGDYALRQREAQRAAEILGCELRVLMPDGAKRVEDLKSYELVALLDREVRELEPAALLTHGAGEIHRDHRMVHEAALATQRLRYFDFFCYHPNFCRPVPVPFHPRAYVDITETIDTGSSSSEGFRNAAARRTSRSGSAIGGRRFVPAALLDLRTIRR